MLKRIKNIFTRAKIQTHQNMNVDSQIVSFQIDEEVDTSKLAFRFILDNCFNVDHIWLKKYGLDLILIHQLNNLPENINFILCITQSTSNRHEEIQNIIESSEYYSNLEKLKTIIYDGVSDHQLYTLKKKFPSIRFLELERLKLRIAGNKSPNFIIDKINQQILSLDLAGNYGAAILDASVVDINFESNTYKFAMLHSLFNYQKRYLVNHKVRQIIDVHNKRFEVQHKNAIVVHCYYLDLMQDVQTRIVPLKEDFDFFISLPSSISEKQITDLLDSGINFRVELLVDNQGRDIAPFLRQFEYLSHYNWVLKIHTKKSLHRSDGNTLRTELWDSLFSLDLRKFDSNDGMIALNAYKINLESNDSYSVLNALNMKYLLKKMQIKPYVKYFVAGSMFWFRPSALKQLASLSGAITFPFECGQNDGEIQHAIERIFCILVEYNGYTVQLI